MTPNCVKRTEIQNPLPKSHLKTTSKIYKDGYTQMLAIFTIRCKIAGYSFFFYFSAFSHLSTTLITFTNPPPPKKKISYFIRRSFLL